MRRFPRDSVNLLNVGIVPRIVAALAVIALLWLGVFWAL
jgi:hypothetical protein